MGRITQIEDLPTSEVSSDDPRIINGHIRISRICFAGERGRIANPASIRRRLVFDDVNDLTPHEGPSRVPTADFVQQEDKSSVKWNFDFENEVPLPGDWLWVKVGSNSSGTKELGVRSGEQLQKESQIEN